MAALRKATAEERQAYAETKPVYPLYGWVTVDTWPCPVEDLREWSRENPQYEIILPRSYHAKNEFTHTMLCHTLKDVRDTAKWTKLEKCDKSCGNM